ncbi:Putative uncharacterized protein [Moritella viscosa]|uniref:hypothetical protein n=1 Tax=Moritella viscosa TaxID=80854 RepID=UPI00091A2348|nr:hypothetical protein [Moritella viscosa]SGY81479.1 Putative uncharacterized protein [Moritella viscosa]
MSKKINEQVNDDGVDGNEIIVESTSEKPNEAKHDHLSNIVLSGKGKKLSPKTDNHVFFDLAKNDEDSELYLRLSANEGGGLHSKNWVLLQSIITILDEQAQKPFKSTVLKSVFTSSSANNPGFLAAILRSNDIGLITQSGKSVFLHVLATDYEEKKTKLLQLADG